MKLSKRRRKPLVRNPGFAIDTPEIVFGGALLVLTVLKCVAFNGVMQCVAGLNNVQQVNIKSCYTLFPFNIMNLHQCVADVACVAGISKFAQTFFFKHVLFFKLNFNSNLPATHATQLETPMFPHFLPIFTCYTCCYTSATKHLVPATHSKINH